MGKIEPSAYMRIAVALAATAVLLVGWLLLLPGRIAIFPAIVVPIWVAMFAGNGRYDAGARRRAGLVLAAGCLALLIAILAYVLVS